MKRFLIYLIVATLTLPPSRSAQAFVAPLAVPYLVTAAGTSPLTIAAAAAAAAAGAAVLGILFKDSGGADALDVKLNPKAPERVPAGWTPSGTAGAAPIPPGTVAAVLTYGGGSTGQPFTHSSAAAACNAWLSGCSGGFCGGSYTLTSTSGGMCHYTYGAGGSLSGTGSYFSQSSCPTGYTVSGGSCALVSAPLVPYPSDNIGRKDCSTGTCAPSTRDPDTANPAGVTGGPTQVKVKSGTSTTTITVNGDGTVTVKTVTPNGDGTSTGTEIKLAPPNPAAADGGTNATGAGQTQLQGEGDLTTETPPANCAGGPCATEGTQQANRALLQDMKDYGLKIKEDAPAWATQKSTAETGITTTTTAFTTHEGKFTTAQTSGIGALGVPGLSDFTAPGTHAQPGIPGIFVPSAACAPVVSTWGSRSISFDVCPVANFVKPILEWFLYGLAILYVYGAFWRRPQGNA